MDCPYPGCVGDLSGVSFATFCPQCRETLWICSACGFANRVLARFCRHCRQPVPVSGGAGGLNAADLAKFQTPARIIELEDEFWTAPICFRGELWSVSVGGEVFRVAPFRDHPERSGRLEGAGRSPCIIRETRTDTGSRPLLLALSAQAAQAFDLVSREVRTLYRCAEGETLLHSSHEDWVAPEFKDGRLYFLSRKNGSCSLIDVPVDGEEVRRVPLPQAQGLAGPFPFGDGVGVYNQRALLWLRGQQVGTHTFPPDFQAFDSSEGIWGLEAPFGSTVFVAARDSVYIPGLWSGRPGFLYAAPGGGALRFNAIPLGEASFASDDRGRLLVARAGEIVVYEDGRVTQRHQWPQLAPTGFPYVGKDFWTGHLRTASKYEALLLSSQGQAQEFPLRQLPGGEASLKAARVCRVRGALLFCYCGARNEMKVAVWEL